MIDRQVLRDREELVKEASKFPVDFAQGGPFGLADRLSVPVGGKDAEISDYLAELKDIASREDVVPFVFEFFEEQMKRWLADLERNPNNKYVLNNVGNAYISRGSVDNAIDCFVRALEADKSFTAARTNLARAYLIAGRTHEALEIYLDMVQSSPKDTSALLNLAHVYMRLGRLDNARDVLGKLLDLDPGNCSAHNNRGLLHLMEGKPQKAVGEFRKAVSSDARFMPGYNALGAAYAILGQHKKSARYFRIYWAANSTDPDAIGNLATSHYESGEFAEATKLLEPYLAKYPRDWDARNTVANSYYGMKDHKRALAHLLYLVQNADNMMLTRDQKARVLNNAGVTYCNMGQLAKAEPMFAESVATVEGNIPVPNFNLAQLYSRLGQKKQAKRVLEQYLEKEPADTSAMVMMADFLNEKDELAEAEEFFARALEVDPDCRDAAIGLSSISTDREDYERAIAILRRGLAAQPKDKTMLNNLAYAQLMSGSVAEAAEMLQKAKWDKDDFFAWATMGLLRIREDRVEEGIALYKKAAASAPAGEVRRIVRQKRDIELARYYFSYGKREAAAAHLRDAQRLRTNSISNRREMENLLEGIRW